MTDAKKFSAETRVAHAGRAPLENYGVVNPPVYHASTILFKSLEEMDERARNKMQPENINYGRQGTPSTFPLERAIAELEGGDHAFTVSSGLGAITTALFAFVKTGDRILMPDTVYAPTRMFCNDILRKMGVETVYYDPLAGSDIAALITGNTSVVFVESPGSLTFEIQDIPAIAEAAHAKGAIVMLDNTWGTPLYCKSFELGVDVSVHAGTKYIVGHSDAMLGLIVTTDEHYTTVKNSVYHLGQCAGPDDIYLGQRGLRTMAVRLKQHHESGLQVAKWLSERPEVARVLHPALPEHPGHELWKRDFSGTCGLFAFILDRHYSRTAMAAMVDNMELFGMGYSWGGYESLILPANPASIRTATKWEVEGDLVRLHIGLENVEDLISDLDAGFKRLSANA
ncbi:cystathionine beta-lyase [Kiloniella sp. b19]|uniref:cystathionine beta-lyase n=1 Tax=Kiloniella sp. GXU_MW_B19 TaxID=3141326 RepID=UPI0031D38089